MDRNKPLFLNLSREDQKAAIEAMIFASEEPLTLDTLFKILIVGKNVKLPVQNTTEQKTNGTTELSEQPKELKTNGEAVDSSATIEPKKNGSAAISVESDFDYEKEAKNKWDFSVGLFEELITEINIELIQTNRPFQIIKVGGGYQFCTRREYGELIHHLSRGRARRRFSQAALECLAIIAYRQPVTKPEIDQIRGINSNEIVNSLVEKNLVMPVGQKETIGRPWMYGTTTEFLKAFGLESLEDLPKLRELDEVVEMLNAENPEEEIVIDVTGDSKQEDMFNGVVAVDDSVTDENKSAQSESEDSETSDAQS
jgi:segregation and condensation protein B